MQNHHHKPVYTYPEHRIRSAPKKPRSIAGAVLLFAAAGLMICSWIFLRDLSTQIAVSDACDFVTQSVSKTVNDTVTAGGYGYDYFETLEKNDAGEVVAVSSNMAHINSLSSEILDKVVGTTESGALTVKIPLGNLTGVNMLMGRGPDVPVKIIYLTSSKVDFKNELVTAGINQTKHQLSLEVTVDVDILVPWRTVSSQVVTDVLIADTVIVGQVPDTYVNME